ncbi:MAG: hypothetical protein JSU85_08745 [Candidatus Zixiibacteriota bacterium]|nr:MAG: hypothetical protein JSU85_08745 [candidate division Zixibacteria bacterium]
MPPFFIVGVIVSHKSQRDLTAAVGARLPRPYEMITGIARYCYGSSGLSTCQQQLHTW